jgi:exopolysaccharide biosynthesis polyprenyl glycosylphosphotransferase
MLKQNWRLISRIQRVGDIVIILASFFVAYYGRTALVYWNDIFQWHLPFVGDELAPIKDNFIALVVGILGYQLSLTALGAYSSMRLITPLHLLRISLASSVFVFFTLAATLFLLKIDLSRSFLGLFCALVWLSLTLQRLLVLKLLRFYRRRGRNFRNILICGSGDQAIRLARELARMPELGLWIRAFVALEGQGSAAAEEEARFKSLLKEAGYEHTIRFLVGKEALLRALSEYAIDEVIFTDVVEVMPLVEEMVIVCSEQGVRTTLVADLFSVGIVKSGISYFGGMPLIHFQTPPGDQWELWVKRMVDVSVSFILLVLLSPLFLLIALAIKLDSPGPVLYVQRRVGLNGRLFNLYKFRSMKQDADQQLAELRAKNEMQGPVFKMKEDPRVTRVGRLLRRFSLDELPQLWNVYSGEMSLVGPRPPIPGEVSMYERKDRRRLSMRPGLTCIWQVSGRNEITNFDHWVRLDLEYIDNWSLTRDFILLLRTVPAVLFGTGAR